MAGKVRQLSEFIVTKATNLGLSVTQVVNVDDAAIMAAIPAQHRQRVSGVVLRKAKQSAIDKYITQKATELADSQDFKDNVAAVIPELVITQEIIKRIIVQKVKELRV
jgi:hypothetical protein